MDPPSAASSASASASAQVRSDLDLGLARVSALLCAVRHPERHGFRSGGILHVAGTNGKGGTTAFLASLLLMSHPGIKVATFTSPHLIHPSDSWRINGLPVTPIDYDHARAHVLSQYNNNNNNNAQPPTHFELDVAAALWHFATIRCDYVVVEVGVGGRDDATNVFRHDTPLPCPCSLALPPGPWPRPNLLATVITRIGIDHQALLGHSITAIAKHKAGILARDPVPCIVGPQSHPDQVHAAVDEEAKRVGCSRVLWVSSSGVEGPGVDVGLSDPPGAPPVRVLRVPQLPGNVAGYQVANAATAIAVLAAIKLLPASDPDRVVHALAATRWLGRLHHLPLAHTLPICRPHGPDVIVDGAHNVDGAHQLAAYLFSLPAPPALPPTCWIVGLSAGRDPYAMLQALGIQSARGDRVVCIEFEPVEHMPWVRPVPRREVGKVAREGLGVSAVFDEEAGRVWEVKKEWIQGVGRVVVAGSLYLVADVYRWLEREDGASVFQWSSAGP